MIVLRVPTHVYELLSKVKKCENMLSQQGKPVNDEIVSEILHTTARRIRKARNALKKNVQLDAPLHDANHHMHDVIEVGQTFFQTLVFLCCIWILEVCLMADIWSM